jgi:hypothetical protein
MPRQAVLVLVGMFRSARNLTDGTGRKRALMGHQAENVTQEYGWQESERILAEAEAKLRALSIGWRDKRWDKQPQTWLSPMRPGGLEPPAS